MKIEETYKDYEICLNSYYSPKFKHTKYIAFSKVDCDANSLIGESIDDIKTQIDEL